MLLEVLAVDLVHSLSVLLERGLADLLCDLLLLVEARVVVAGSRRTRRLTRCGSMPHASYNKWSARYSWATYNEELTAGGQTSRILYSTQSAKSPEGRRTPSKGPSLIVQAFGPASDSLWLLDDHLLVLILVLHRLDQRHLCEISTLVKESCL